jgi:hypothetical protein
MTYGLTPLVLKKLSQKNMGLLSSIAIVPVALFAHDLINTENEEELKKKVTNFKDELYISSLVGSFIPLFVDLTLLRVFGVDPSLKSVALTEAAILLRNNLDDAKQSMSESTFNIVKASLDSSDASDASVKLIKSTFDIQTESFQNTLGSSIDGIYYKLTGAPDLNMSDALSRVVSRIAVQVVNFLSYLGIKRLTKNRRHAHFLKYTPCIIYMAIITPSFH